MAAKTKAPTTSLIKCTPDITRTQAMIAASTASKMPVNHKGEAAGEHFISDVVGAFVFAVIEAYIVTVFFL